MNIAFTPWRWEVLWDPEPGPQRGFGHVQVRLSFTVDGLQIGSMHLFERQPAPTWIPVHLPVRFDWDEPRAQRLLKEVDARWLDQIRERMAYDASLAAMKRVNTLLGTPERFPWTPRA